MYSILQTIIILVVFVELGFTDYSNWNGLPEGGRIYFYTGSYQTGTGYVLDLGFKGACFRIDPNSPAELTSIDTNGACIYVFEDNSCEFTGKWRKLRRYQYESNNLNTIGLAGAIQSVRSCSAYLIPVYLYTERSYTGDRYRVDIYAKSGCTNIPSIDREHDTKSVFLNDDAICVILYETLNCQGKGVRIQNRCSTGSRDLAKVDFVKHVKSVQTCVAAHSIHARYRFAAPSISNSATKAEFSILNSTLVQVRSQDNVLPDMTEFPEFE